MSQFVFGEILLPADADKPPSYITIIPDYPFSLRFNILPSDFYRQITSLDVAAVPFVITDSIYDNTAELLLQLEFEYNGIGNFPECYTKLSNTSLKERINLIVNALQEALAYFHASECLLIFSDGYDIPINHKECHINSLADEILALTQLPSPFVVSSFWIKD